MSWVLESKQSACCTIVYLRPAHIGSTSRVERTSTGVSSNDWPVNISADESHEGARPPVRTPSDQLVIPADPASVMATAAVTGPPGTAYGVPPSPAHALSNGRVDVPEVRVLISSA